MAQPQHPLHAAIQAFMDSPVDSAGATVLASMISALKDPMAAWVLVVQHRATAVDCVNRLLRIANDDTKNTAARILCLEGFFWVSQVADETFRQRELFAAVSGLNASFEALLERDASVIGLQKEMLMALLMRCTGYVRLRAGDLLHQLCGGDERQLVPMLVNALRNRAYEWQLILAAMRCLYELTTPLSYFQPTEPGQPLETTKVTAFQTRLNGLLAYLLQSHTLRTIMEEAAARWVLSTADRVPPSNTEGVGALGRPATLNGVNEITNAQRQELLQWAVLFRYISVLAGNLAEFASEQDSIRALQRSLLAECAPALAGAVVPFIMAILHTWERTQAAGAAAAQGALIIAGSGAGSNEGHNPYLNAAMAALRLLRMALYKPAATPPVEVLSAVSALTQQANRLEPLLRSQYIGMLTLIYVVECLCNVNARLITAPVNLAGSLDVLLTTIASDKSPLRPGARCSTAQGFAICFGREESIFAAMSNESIDLIHEKFKAEEQVIREDEEAFEAIEMLEGQLDVLQQMIMQIALSQLLGELAMAGTLVPGGSASGHSANPLAGRGGQAGAAAGAPPPPEDKKKKKKKHPARYCCQLTGKLMKEPVTLKNGHHFELDALEKVVDDMGHVDPLTGEAFNDAIEVDQALQQEIAQYRVTKAAEKQQ